ncbi:MAG: hypothetical protein KC496_14765 [Anaerolineae bacterium]|nr:hypothetical protein [Anaerolineae bacterium]
MSDNQQAQLDQIQDSVRVYLPALFTRLALTTVLPITVALLVNAILPILIESFVPLSTATTMAFAANLLVLFFGWRMLENRTHATSLFVLYSGYSSQRRALQNARADAPSLATVQQSAQRFIEAARDSGLQPRTGK